MAQYQQLGRGLGRGSSAATTEWQRRLEALVQYHSPDTRIDQVQEEDGSGAMRFWFTNIDPRSIECVQGALRPFLVGIGTFNFGQRTPPTARAGAVSRDKVVSLYVIINADADEVLERRARNARALCSWPVLLILVSLFVLGFSISELRKHYEGYADPFVHQKEAARRAFEQYVTNP